MTLRTNAGLETRFRLLSEQEAGRWVTFIVAECSRCNRSAKVKPNPTASTSDHPIIASRQFRSWGWRIGGTRASDICPTCAGTQKKQLTPAQRHAAFCKIADVPRAKPKDQPMQKPSDPAVTLGKLAQTPETRTELIASGVVKPEPPRAPSVADRRRVMDALEEHYDIGRSIYTKSWSDEALASKLDVPRAWVLDIRQLMFGEGSGNEAMALREEAIERLDKEVQKVGEEFLERHAAIEAEVRKLKVDRSYGS